MERDLTASPAWAAVLDADRQRANAVLARARAAGADVAALRAAVLDLGPVMQRLSSSTADGTDDGTDAPLRAAGLALLGAAAGLATTGRWRAGAVERDAVLHLVPDLAPEALADPAGLLEVVVHGSHQVARAGDVAVWHRRLLAAAAAAPQRPVPTPVLRDLGAVAAWRSGVVRLRRAALAAAGDVPADALRAALDLDPDPAKTDPADVLRRNAAEPWWWPGSATTPGRDGEVRVVARLGGFRGLGGPWPRLPRVVGGDGVRWWVRTEPAPRDGEGLGQDGDVPWVVVADVHGSSIRRWAGPVPDAPAPPLVTLRGQRLHVGSASGTAPWDDDLTGAALAGGVAVLSRAHSHCLDVVLAPS